MSSYQPSRGLVNRYWKRPKPRIYECNIRDAERFYKDSYNQYLQSKDFSASHGTKPTNIEEEFATRWTLNRMNSRLESQFDPNKRETSISGYTGDYGINKEDTGIKSSRVTFSRHDSLTENGNDIRHPYRARSLDQPEREKSPESQLENVESRLERIKRLREELGLKSDIMTGDNHLTNEGSRSILKKSSQKDVPNESSGYKSEIYQSSYSSNAGASSRSRDNVPPTDLYESKYSQRNERSTRAARNGDSDNNYASYNNNRHDKVSKSYVTDDSEQYSTHPTRRENKYSNDDKYSSNYRSKGNKYKEEDYAYESKYSRVAKKSSATATSNGEGVSNVDDDDELVSNLKKKFPTSDEILERIKRIDANL